MHSQRAFSLLELSVVLVILGLLVGGIFAGQALIRSSELRSVATDLTRYQSATTNFRDKYLGLPGDIANATSYWGKDATNCNGNTGMAATPGTCNGNGNGMLTIAAAASATGEEFQYWKQLNLAGLIEGTFTGLAGPGGTANTVIGTNVPASRYDSGGYSVNYIGTQTSSSVVFDGDYGNILQIGNQYLTARTGAGLLRTADAWNIDTKMDDGKPAFGIIRADKPTATTAPNCTDSSTASAAGYNLTYTKTWACRIMLLNL